jgi:hypothetical protein
LLKLFKALFLIIIVAVSGFIAFKYQATPAQVIPYPYILKLSKVEGASAAQNSHVLIVGDRMGKALDRFIPTLKKTISVSLEEPLKIYNWSSQYEGLHRTLAKLKTLDTLPPVIVYHGASEEFYEKKFLINKKKTILKNFKLYDNDKISSLIMTVPLLSKFIYLNPNHQLLPTIPREDLTKYSSKYKQFRMELTYKIFEYEINELINYARLKDSSLIFVTTPVNLEIAPKQVCKNSTSEDIKQLQKSMIKQIKRNSLKTIYAQTKELASKSIGNAKSQFIYGTVALSLLKFKEAKNALIRAEAFDCKKWRGSNIFNNIMKKKAKRNNVYLIDFNNMVNLNLGRDTIFHDEFYPQHLYYQQLMGLLETKIRKAYQL